MDFKVRKQLLTSENFWDNFYTENIKYFNNDGSYDSNSILVAIKCKLELKFLKGNTKERVYSQLSYLAKKNYANLRYERNNIIRNIYTQNYRLAEGKWAGGKNTVEILDRESPTINTKVYRSWSKNGKWAGNDTYTTIGVLPTWLSEVHDRGLSCVDGLLTLSAIPIGLNTYKAIWVQQARGLSTKLVEGYILQDSDRYYHGESIEQCYRLLKRDNASKAENSDDIDTLFESLELIDKIVELYGDLKLSRRLALLAGNCKSGIEHWLEQYALSDCKTITISQALWLDPLNPLVQKVVKKAIRRKLKLD
jgi:hypothetical protein